MKPVLSLDGLFLMIFMVTRGSLLTLTSQILKKLQKPLQVPKFSVGLEEHVSRVITLLKTDSDEKLTIVGIHGMGGTGKTTLAMAVFNNICSEFDVRCFLPDVRNNTHAELKRKIVRHLAHKDNYSAEGQILMEPEISISITNALLVLDDRDVLEGLRGSWFDLQGRVLVTTRDKGVLDERHNDVSYELDELNYDQALRLFNWHAFSQEVSDKNYQDLTEKVVKACQGLPLTIEVIARLLCDKRDPKIWTGVIKQLKGGEITKIEYRLRISYNDLSETEKDIFLDIACFFIGSEKSNALSIWESSGLCANLAIHNLHAKSLIKFTSDDPFQMHDILRNMGRALVRKQSPDDPGKRSRIWDEKDVRKAFKDHLGRELIFYGHEIPEWLDHPMQTRMDNYAPLKSPLTEICISMDHNVRCIGVIFCFLSYGKETGIDATVTRGGLEVLRIHIVRNRGEDRRENGEDEIHVFICHKNHDLVKTLQDGDRIHIWTHPLHPYPRTKVKKGGVHLLYRRESEQKQLSEQQQENNLYQRLFLDLTWIQWSWLAWNNLPVNFDIHLLAAHDLACSFISRKISTYSLSLASKSWGHRFSSDVVHVAIEKIGMKWNREECFELETIAFAQIEAAADETTVNMNRTLLFPRNIEDIDGLIGESKNMVVDIYVGNRWLDWRRLLADGRSELQIELGVRATRNSTPNVQVKILSINSICEQGPRSSTSRTLRQSHSVLTSEDILSDKKQYLLL